MIKIVHRVCVSMGTCWIIEDWNKNQFQRMSEIAFGIFGAVNAGILIKYDSHDPYKLKKDWVAGCLLSQFTCYQIPPKPSSRIHNAFRPIRRMSVKFNNNKLSPLQIVMVFKSRPALNHSQNVWEKCFSSNLYTNSSAPPPSIIESKEKIHFDLLAGGCIVHTWFTIIKNWFASILRPRQTFSLSLV